MKIEVLYIRDCPGYSPALAAIEQIVAENRLQASVIAVEVADPGAPGFVGSPTVLIDGKDIESGASASAIGLACRTYNSGGKLRNTPSRDMIRVAIEHAIGRRI